ncbi:MAG: CPBP family intramembrane metalloprotease [Bacteroidales bacterium]
MSIIYLLFIVIVLDTVLNLIVLHIPLFENVSFKEVSHWTKEWSVTKWFIMVIFVAPIVETAFFQCFLILLAKYVLSKMNVKYDIIPIMLSAICFGLNHLFNLGYIIVTFLMGVVYGYLYIAVRRKGANGFITVSLVHSLHNLYPFLNDIVLRK